MNLVDAGLSVRNDSESSFLPCGGPVKHFYVHLYLRRELETVSATVKVLCRLCSPV